MTNDLEEVARYIARGPGVAIAGADYEKSSMRKWRKRQKNPKMLRNPEVKKIGLQLKKLAMNY